jgi:hypothetical protein
MNMRNGLASVLLGLSPLLAAAPAVEWHTTGTGSTYRVEGDGDPMSAAGAHVSIASSAGDESHYGASACGRPDRA